MSTKNVSGSLTLEQLVCSTGLTAGIHGHFTFISAINIFLSITAFLGNALILVAVRKESSLHLPSKLLLRSLPTTDLCVGFVTEPLFVINTLMPVVNEKWSICRYVLIATFTTSIIFCLVSLLTLTAISVDRLLALLLGLRYKQIVTLKRTFVIAITFWVVSTVFSTINFWNFRLTTWYIIIGVLLCLVTSIFCYTVIFLTLRHHQNQLQDQAEQPNQINQLNIARFRKAVYTALWLQLTLVTCSLPDGIVVALVISNGLSLYAYVAWCYAATFLFLNSSLNPILYCWKIKEVRQAVKDKIRQVLCCSWS